MSAKQGHSFIFLWFSLVTFILTVGFAYFFISKQNQPEKNAIRITNKLTNEIEYIEPIIKEIGSIISSESNLTFNALLKPCKYPYYMFSNKRVVFWSNNLFSPIGRDILGEFTLRFIETTRGKFIVRKEVFLHENKPLEVVFLIPLTESSAVVNEYLKNTYNEHIFTDPNFEIQGSSSEEYQDISIDGKYLFSVKFGNTYTNSDRVSSAIIIALILISFLFLGIFVKSQLKVFVKEKQIINGFVFLLSSIIIIRSLMLITRFPLDFVYIDLFDPKYYASSLVNPSFGDLLLNLISLLFLGIYIFNHFLKSDGVKRMLKGTNRSKVITAGICFFFSFFWLAVHHQTMKTLNVDSQWSMDISQQLEFNYLKVISYALFFISVVVYFLFAHISFRLVNKLTQHSKYGIYFAMLIGVVAFLLFALILRWDFEVVMGVNLVFFLIINHFKLTRFIGKIQYLTFIYFFSFGLPGAIIGVYANYQYYQSSTNFNKSRLANQLLVERNFFTELQLDDVSRLIKEDFFIQKRLFSPFASKLIIEKKIRREYLNNLDKFDIQIYVFNSRGEPFEQFNLKENYFDFKSKLSEFKTETEGLYFINQARGQATSRYMDFIEISDRDQVIGYILLDLRQKRLVPNSVFPLLLNENLDAQLIDGTERYSYGVFHGKELQYNYGEFNYRKNLAAFVENADQLFEKSVHIQGYNHKAFLGENNRFVIVSAKEPTLVSRFANFSFLFLIYIFTILLILFVVTFYQQVQHVKLNYSAKIQLYLNFAFFTPLIIVSVTTVSIIVQTFKSSLEAQYVEFAENLSTKISGPLNDYNTTRDKEGLSEEIFQMAEIADLDINVFNTNGRLIGSSLFQIYQSEILSSNIEPRAYIKIIEESESAFVLEEQVGLLIFKNAYVSVRSYETGEIIGILSLPFFASQRDLELNIVEVLSNIINIFTFVFIIFLFVSFFVSRGLTFPLRLITQKIKRTTLSTFNEPLSWNSDDEIGMMVSEYNRMLVNLEYSKQALAKSEKESAWREMARQVAHEIKNPLTPMKLTLQHMKRVIDDKGGDDGESGKKQKQINTLLEQIETLSDIATSFSDFAKMPTPQLESLDISILLQETIELYNKKELGRIKTHIEPGKFMIEGDRKWLGRAFSNLIINAFQAVNEKNAAKIEVNLSSFEKDKVRIEIKDNGSGIPEHIRDKVFTPNFSTKYTGSGLGLAITKKGIEHANGTIWFNSEEGIGTTFYIDLPIIP